MEFLQKVEHEARQGEGEKTSNPAGVNDTSAGSPGEPAKNTKQEETRKKPVVCIIMGMAGSGKTTLLQRLNLYTAEKGIKSYFINLDPAVKQVPFGASIDIRDTVNYKEVMKQYGLGPNGAITTSLNLFATRFDQVLDLLEKRSDDLEYVFIDTPGQIEVFTWSASGQIITETLASAFPTTMVYVVDTPRTANPTTFMSNMLYACSVLYKSRLPLVLALNKSDILSPKFAFEWMSDFEKLQEALDSSGDESYMNSLNRSLSLVLDEFYNALTAVAVSAASGDGMPALFKALDNAALEFERDYLPELQRRVADVKQRQEAAKQGQMEKLMTDMAISSGEKSSPPKPVEGESAGKGDGRAGKEASSTASGQSSGAAGIAARPRGGSLEAHDV